MLRQSKKISEKEKKCHGKSTMTPRQMIYTRKLTFDDYRKGLIKTSDQLKIKLIQYANDFYKTNNDDAKLVTDLPKSTFYDFLGYFHIPTPNQYKKLSKTQIKELEEKQIEIEVQSNANEPDIEVTNNICVTIIAHNPQSESTQATSGFQPKTSYYDADNQIISQFSEINIIDSAMPSSNFIHANETIEEKKGKEKSKKTVHPEMQKPLVKKKFVQPENIVPEKHMNLEDYYYRDDEINVGNKLNQIESQEKIPYIPIIMPFGLILTESNDNEFKDSREKRGEMLNEYFNT